MSDNEERSKDERQQKRLELIGWGIVVAGLSTLVVASVSTRPHGILVYGLLGLAVAVLVLEKTQGGATGLSLGLLTGSFGV
jgi:F0F1-type ATP synthase assembly protein I